VIRWRIFIEILGCLAATIGSASASGLVLHGKVEMEDGSVPDRAVSIERHAGITLTSKSLPPTLAVNTSGMPMSIPAATAFW
jgi:hypothetical protein